MALIARALIVIAVCLLATPAMAWRLRMPGQLFNSVVVDVDGNVVAGGGRSGTGVQSEKFVMKLRGTDGGELWRYELPGNLHTFDMIHAVRSTPRAASSPPTPSATCSSSTRRPAPCSGSRGTSSPTASTAPASRP